MRVFHDGQEIPAKKKPQLRGYSIESAEERLGERLKSHDEPLMQTIREQQETKKMLAAAQEKKKWWQFWIK